MKSCPYCSQPLDPAPKGGATCPHCGETIYIKNGRLLTKEEKEKETWLISLRIGEAEYERTRKSLASTFGFEPPWHDTVWRMLTRRVADTKEPGDLAEVYRLQSIFLRAQGKDASQVEREEAKWRLVCMKQQGIPRVILQTCNDEVVCSVCKALEGTTMSADEALEKLPFPTVCTNPDGCRCHYVGAY
jgi:uncharacterized Zn finger protein (UPF0148 family)